MDPDRGATVLHGDLDAFYASVEQLLDPSLRGRPVAVGAEVVLAASYEAKAMGVHSAMPGWRACQLCPDLRFVPGRFDEYRRLGDQVMEVFLDFTPLVERVSIDEAFLDVGGARRLFGSPREIAIALRERVRRELGLPLSVGVAQTKHLAKVVSQVAKPDGMIVVEPGQERSFLEDLPVRLLWGVGPATGERLASVGIRTIGQLASAPGSSLEQLIGKAAGRKLSSLASNIDPRRVETVRRASSVGAQAALGRRVASPQLVRTTLGYLADRVGRRLRASGRAGRKVEARVRFTGLRSVTRSATLPAPVSATLTLTELATELTHSALTDHSTEREITLLAISVGSLVDQGDLQLELDMGLGDDRYRPDAPLGSARSSVDRSMDAIRSRFGRQAVGYASTVFSTERRVPESFRELAEHDPSRR